MRAVGDEALDDIEKIMAPLRSDCSLRVGLFYWVVAMPRDVD